MIHYVTNLHNSKRYTEKLEPEVRSQELPVGHRTAIQLLAVCLSQNWRIY